MSTHTEVPSSTSSEANPSMTDGAQAKAQDAAARVQDQAQAALGQAQVAASQAQDRLRDQVDQRSTQLGEQINAQASDLRSVSDALREKGQDSPAKLADRLAGYAEQAGSYLKEKDPDTILSDAEGFGRQRPSAVAAGALALGFAASRFLKASSSRRYSSGGQSLTPSAPRGVTGNYPVDLEPEPMIAPAPISGTL